MGSACEVENFLLLAHDLGFIRRELHEEVESGVCEVKRMLTSLLRTLVAAEAES